MTFRVLREGRRGESKSEGRLLWEQFEGCDSPAKETNSNQEPFHPTESYSCPGCAVLFPSMLF